MVNLKEKTLYIRQKNATYLEVLAVDSIVMSLWDFFSFYVPGYLFMPKYKMKVWDGKLHLYNRNTCEIYVGLLPHIKEYARINDYKIEYTDDGNLDIEDEFSVTEASNFAKKLDIHAKRIENNKDVFIPLIPHDYQLTAFRHAVQTKRCLLLSPTASGKSLIIYLLIRYYQERVKGKILVIVPTVNLVHQLFNDFGEYSYTDKWDVRDEVHLVYQGQDKSSEKQIILSTWESIYKLGIDYFGQFDMVIGDECLHPDTKIKTILGEIPIKNIKIGTLVYSQNDKGVVELKPVIEIHKNINLLEKMLEITFDSGEKIKITGNHKILTKTGLIRADKLLKNDIIIGI
jgi:hypothetical protein